MNPLITPIITSHYLDSCLAYIALAQTWTRWKSTLIDAIREMPFEENLEIRDTKGRFLWKREYEENGVPKWILTCKKAAVSIQTTNYPGWSTFNDHAMCFAERIIEILPQICIGTGLVFRNRFRAENVTGAFPLSSIFNEQSPFITPAFMSVAHTPALSEFQSIRTPDIPDDLPFIQTLIQISCDSSRKDIDFKIMHEELSRFKNIDPAEKIRFCEYFLKDSHEHNKKTLAEILNPSTCEIIACAMTAFPALRWHKDEEGPKLIRDLHLSAPFQLGETGNKVEIHSETGYARRKEKLHRKIDTFYDKPAGWDFYGKDKTSRDCLDMANKFLDLINLPLPLPQFGAGTGENVSFFWRTPTRYMIVNMLAGNRINFYYRADTTRYYGEMDFSFSCLPQPISDLILMAGSNG